MADLSPVQLAADLTQANIEVNAGYSGASISVFGAVFGSADTPSDVVIVVRGPDERLSIARRERRAGLWLSGGPQRVEGAPGFHLTASSRDLARIATPAVLREAGAGLGSLPVSTSGGAEFNQAVIRLKRGEGLYEENPKGVDFVDRGLFRARVDLPVSAPVGRYQVAVILFQDGQAVARPAGGERNQNAHHTIDPRSLVRKTRDEALDPDLLDGQLPAAPSSTRPSSA